MMGIGSSLRVVLVVAAGAASALVPGCSCAQHSAAPAAQARSRKLAALKELRDSGVLSEEEYQAKVAALGGTAPAAGAQARTLAEQRTKGPGTPTVAHTLMDQSWGLPWGVVRLPAGWGFNGGVIHAGVKGCVASGDSPMFTAESPDRQYGMSVLPLLKTNWSTDPQMSRMMQGSGCPMVPARSAAEYLTRYILPHLHTSFQVVEAGPEPMFAQQVQQMAQGNQQMDQMGNSGPYMRTRHHADAARVLVSYQEGGRTIHEVASALVSCTDTTMQMPMIQGSRPSETIECLGLIGLLLHAPDDGTPFTLAAMNSAKPDGGPGFFRIEQNPAWQQRFQQAAQQTQQQIAAEGQANLAASQQSNDNSQSEFAKQQAIRQGVSDYSRQVHNNVYGNRQAANAQVNGAYAAHMGDYNVYTNPTTGQQVQMSNQYSNTYVDANGNYGLQTNSSSNPGVNWTLMQPKY